MDTSPQVLIALANCYRCVGVRGSGQLLKLGLLVQIATSLNSMVDTTPQTLLANSKCYNCYSNADMGLLLELGLLKTIADNIGSGVGGGGSSYLATPGPPVGTPAANGLQNIIVDSNGQQWMYWGGAWQ